MAGELIPIRVAITSKAHKFLTKRALRLGRDREEEAGRLITWACVELIERARRSETPQPQPKPQPRTYTQAEFDLHMAGLRRVYEGKMAALRESLNLPAAEGEATDGARE